MRAHLLAAALVVAVSISAWAQDPDPETCPQPDDVAAFMAETFPDAHIEGTFERGRFTVDVWRADRASTDMWMIYETVDGHLCLVGPSETDRRQTESVLGEGA